MRLLELAGAILVGLAAVAFLVGRYPINPTLRWKGEATSDRRDIAPTAAVKTGAET